VSVHETDPAGEVHKHWFHVWIGPFQWSVCLCDAARCRNLRDEEGEADGAIDATTHIIHLDRDQAHDRVPLSFGHEIGHGSVSKMNDESFVALMGCRKSKKAIAEAEERLSDHVALIVCDLIRSGLLRLPEIR